LPKWMAPGSFIRNFLDASNVELGTSPIRMSRRLLSRSVKYFEVSETGDQVKYQGLCLSEARAVRNRSYPIETENPGYDGCQLVFRGGNRFT
jgi:hypothetical protein